MSAARARQFVDTNVLVYAHDKSAGEKHTRARQLLEDLWQSEAGCLSIQVLQEFYLTITQKVAHPLSAEAALQIIADLSVWEVHCPIAADVLEAVRLQQRHQISFWDAMIVASSVQLGCDILWTEDLSHGQVYGGTRVQNPFA